MNLNIRYSGTANAFWDGGASSAYFAPGFGVAIDVVTHELMHGVTDFASCLTYDGDSGAVSEFISDFFASAYKGEIGKPQWIIGETLAGYKSPNPPLRSFSAPHLNGFNATAAYNQTNNRGQPETFSEYVRMDQPLCATSDIANHCAHINSGILNRAIYLVSAGGSLDGASIHGIGVPKALSIVNSSLSLMGTSMSLQQMASLIVRTCTSLQLAGHSDIHAGDCSTVSSVYSGLGLL